MTTLLWWDFEPQLLDQIAIYVPRNIPLFLVGGLSFRFEDNTNLKA